MIEFLVGIVVGIVLHHAYIAWKDHNKPPPF